MNNTILNGLLEEFCNDFSIYAEESKAYEHLINYLIVNRVHPEAVETAEQILSLNVDNGGNFGIDGLAIFVNDNLILNENELPSFMKSKSNEVCFTFIQTKTSSNIDTGDISKFFRAVQSFFQKDATIIENSMMKKRRSIKDALFKREFAKNNSKDSPICTMYFAFTGKDFQDTVVREVIKQEKDNLLRACPEIMNLDFVILDSDRTITLYNDNANCLEIDISFRDRILLENINGVAEAYSGFLDLGEFLKLVEDESGKIRKNIFYENVRDYLGDDNPVNQEIIKTICDEQKQPLFPLLNNGITIIAKYIKPLVGNKFIIKDYQIVNGCQTSNVLYKYKDKVTDAKNFLIPSRIIYTNDTIVMEQIIRANNKQSIVPEEAFIALEQFHKRLQEYYKQMSKKAQIALFYERRAREVSNNGELSVSKNQIVTLHSQIRAYVSTYLKEPHLVYSNNPTFILKYSRKNIFNETDSFAPYYLSAYIIYYIRNKMAKERTLYNKYHEFTYYIAFILRALVTKRINPPESSDDRKNEVEKDQIISLLQKEKEFSKIFNICTEILDEVLNKRDFKTLPKREVNAMVAFESAIKGSLMKYIVDSI